MLNESLRTAKGKILFARGLRNRSTPGEKLLWQKLRGKRFKGYKFRRQVPLGPYIADFLCTEAKLIIEIDGTSHYEEGAKERDTKRTEYLEGKGFRVVRFGERQTAQCLEAVLEELARALNADS